MKSYRIYLLSQFCVALMLCAVCKSSYSLEVVDDKANVLLYIDQSHFLVSRQIFRITNRLDSFFGNKRSLDEANGSRLRLYYLATKQEGLAFRTEPGVKIHLRFKELEKRLLFKFEKKPTAPDFGNKKVDGELESKLTKVDDIDSYTASLGFIIKESKKWFFSTEGGVRVEKPINPFLRSSLRRSIILRKWELRLQEEIFLYANSGFGESTSIEFDRPFGQVFLFRFANNAVWRDQTDSFSITHSLSLFHTISERRALNYNFRSLFVNKPTYELVGHDLYLSFRQLLYKRWFFAEIIPGVSFLKERNFSGKGYISLKIEAVFGSF